jgi:hypothetical protein
VLPELVTSQSAPVHTNSMVLLDSDQSSQSGIADVEGVVDQRESEASSQLVADQSAPPVKKKARTGRRTKRKDVTKPLRERVLQRGGQKKV